MREHRRRTHQQPPAPTVSLLAETGQAREHALRAEPVLPSLQLAHPQSAGLSATAPVPGAGSQLDQVPILPSGSSHPYAPDLPVERRTHVWIQPAIPRWDPGPTLPLQRQEDLGAQVSARLRQGTPLQPDVRATLEGGLGADLSGVQMHTDGEADRLARSVQAVAFTTGSDIFFRQGAYNPGTPQGLQLLAHEATHTVQQSRGAVDGTPHPGGISISDPSDRFEQAADSAASDIAAASPSQSMAPAVQRRPAQVELPLPVQRVIEPAVVTKADGAGLHKSDVKSVAPDQDVTVRSGGIFGTGIKDKIPTGTQISVDPDKGVTDPQYIWADYAGTIGFVRKTYLALCERVGNSSFYALQSKPGYFRIFDRTVNAFITDEESNDLKAGVVGVLGHLTDAEVGTGLAIRKKEEIVQGLLKQAKLPGGSLPNPDLWEEATENIESKIIPRVNRDKNLLITAGLLTRNHQLKSLQFTGADFHKHGQAPVFLYFETGDARNPDPRKIVYKPGNLSVDARIFGTTDSLAQSLDTAGTKISQYAIIPRERSGEKYGFMEFVESDTPRTADDLRGVYRSLAANMALSYLVGLEDVHQENVLLLRDRVQVIDMEATTGLFKKVSGDDDELDVSQGGFKAQLWLKALNEGIKPKLETAAGAGTLQSAPATGAALAAMRTAFRSVLDQAKAGGFKDTWDEHKDALAGMRSRVVPVATADFYAMMTPVSRRSFEQWTAFVNGDEGEWLVNQSRGQTGATTAFIRRVMVSRGTYNALRRGEIPYYTRDLGSSRIFDEEGNRIDETGFPKVGRAIGVEMTGRRKELRAEGRNAAVYGLFEGQIIPEIRNLNDSLRQTLAAH